jgi:mono/diheme cytochrome c family protein
MITVAPTSRAVLSNVVVMMRRALLLCVALAAVVGVACEEPPATEPYARGRQLFRQLDCGRCHVIDGGGGSLGPDLSHIGTAGAGREAGVSAEDYTRESILSPGAYIVPGYNDVMPRGLAQRLSQSDLDALVLYLASHR